MSWAPTTLITGASTWRAGAISARPPPEQVLIDDGSSGHPFCLCPLVKALEHVTAHAEKIWLTASDDICDRIAANPGLAV